MQAEALDIPDVKLVTPRRFADDRGFFSETYNARTWAEAGIEAGFVQDNHSRSVARGTVRGLHFQSPPHAQAKLVRVLQGRIFDVAVDVRVGSPTFGRWVGAELDADTGTQIFVPQGFLHGFMTLEDDTHVAYKVDDFYAPECDGCVRFDDPAIGIEWPINPAEAKLSAKDGAARGWAEFVSPFRYGRKSSMSQA